MEPSDSSKKPKRKKKAGPPAAAASPPSTHASPSSSTRSVKQGTSSTPTRPSMPIEIPVPPSWTVHATTDFDVDPKFSWRARAFPGDFAFLDMVPGDLVLLSPCDPTSESSTHSLNSKEISPPRVGVLWFDKTVQAGSIVMSSLHLLNVSIRVGDRVKISKYFRNPIPISRITIKSTTPHPLPDAQFLKILAQEYMRDIKYFFENGVVEFCHNSKQLQFRVVSIESHDFVARTEGKETGIFVFTGQSDVNALAYDQTAKKWGGRNESTLSYDSIGGLSEQIGVIRKMVEVPLHHPDRFSKYGVRPPRGILLYGPPGTGKTLIARAVASETGAHVIVINGPEIISKYYGETEEKLKSVFEEAEENSPSIIFIDEIDSLCPKRDANASDLEKRIVATLLTLMDGSKGGNEQPGGVIVMAATNRPNQIDDALRRPGRFDRELEIGIPDPIARLQILHALFRKIPHSLSEENIGHVAAITHGYVGADLSAIVREAGLQTLKRLVAGNSHYEDSDAVSISYDDVQAALTSVAPSVMREVALEVPDVRWSDIGGLEDIKMRIREAVEWPLKHPEAFQRFKIRPPKGILMYGPPGCSKTLMAKALATEAGLNFLAVKGPELFSKWVGDSEKAVRDIFKKARAASPSDEIDAIAVRRGNDNGSVSDRVLSQLLSEMDGIEPLVNVTVIAATNRPDILDSALLRPGRMDRILYVAPPDYQSRLSIFKIRTSKMSCATDVDCPALAELTDGYSGAEVVSVCQEAAMFAMEENPDAEAVSQKHFIEAISRVTPRITADMIEFYNHFRHKSGLRSI
ncbi:spermatogenesis associated protein 5 [Entophlyctis sp. JEL0112]|nr:spermatogenesis associated protein 5 [Entophlyctis sp. JEL0112]